MALDALREAGYRVPEEVPVVGFDDLDMNPHQAVTTVRQPLQVGQEGVRLLLRRLQTKDDPPLRQRISLEPMLIVRTTPETTPVRRILPQKVSPCLARAPDLP
jgi:DNA-binding LacI/PurR family transcriptional regulator